MARVRAVEIDEVPPQVQDIYRKFAIDYGPFLNQVRVFAHRPMIVKHLMSLLMELADEALVPKRYLEIALVAVSRLNECAYCVAHHTPRLVEQGLAPETAARILDDDCPGLDEIDRLVRDYAVQVTLRPQYIRDVIFAELKKHFTEAQIVELTFRIALCGFFNRFNDALQIDIEDGALRDLLAAGATDADLPRSDKGLPPAAERE